MPRTVPLTPEQVPAESKPTLDAFSKSLGFTPNMLATFARSPNVFDPEKDYPSVPPAGSI